MDPVYHVSGMSSSIGEAKALDISGEYAVFEVKRWPSDHDLKTRLEGQRDNKV
jgi:hypothetical protein